MPSSKLDDHATAGLEGMDREHAVEMQMVHALQAALTAGDRTKAIVLMDQLEVFANAHFMAEQHLMRLHAYPGFERLIAELRELSTHVLGHPDAGSQESVEALERWLLNHIRTEDEALAEFLRTASGAGERA